MIQTMEQLAPMVLKLLAHVATDTLRLQLILSLSNKSEATVSRQFLQAIRLIIQYHPRDEMRDTYLQELDHLLRINE